MQSDLISTTRFQSSPNNIKSLIILLLAVAAIQLITMPDFFYRGDAFTSRAEAIQLLTQHRLGIPYTERSSLGAHVVNRGEYFYENDARQLLFSKYGIANDLLHLPPLLAETILAPPITPLHATHSLLLWINIYQILWSLLMAAYLYCLAALYTERKSLRIGFVLTSIYATMLWHYLRAPTTEIYQITALLGLLYHTLRYLRTRSTETISHIAWKQLGYAALWATSLSLMRSSFVLLHLALAIYLLQWTPGSTFLRGVATNLTKHFKPFLIYLLLPSLAGVCILLITNDYKFGSPFATGYGQWVRPDGTPVVIFSTSYLVSSLRLFLLSPGNGNIFLHYPLILLALIGWPEFFRSFRAEAGLVLLLAATVVIPILLYNHADGEWCYGPRFLLPLLPVLSIPAIQGWRLISATRSRRLLQILIAEVLLLSVILQIGMNALDYFTWYDVKDYMGDAIPGVTDRYLDHYWHRGILHLQLIFYSWFDIWHFPLLEMVRPILTEPMKIQADQALHQFAEANFWLAH